MLQDVCTTIGCNILIFIKNINILLQMPFTVLAFLLGIIITVRTRFIQVRAFPHFLKLLRTGTPSKSQTQQQTADTTQNMSSLQGLFTAMATTIGMGNIVGPSIAISVGGPGALFWLVGFSFIGSVIKYAEVMFALHTRKKAPDGSIVGGPIQYLKLVNKKLALWYGSVMVMLFVAWSGMQANTLARIYALEGMTEWHTGLLLTVVVFSILIGGAQRVGDLATKLVPIMFILYVSFALLILLKDLSALRYALGLMFSNVFSSPSPIGGFAGATVMQAMSYGILRGTHITESGVGTSSIPHAMVNVAHHVDQGILAMFSGIADAILSLLSGLLTLVTGVWTVGGINNTLMYEVFKSNSPIAGRYILLISITLFVFTTILGNSFNGTQNFSAFTKQKGVRLYQLFSAIAIFLGSLMYVPLVWELADLLLVLVAIPNMIGVLWLVFKYPDVLRYNN